MEIVFNSHQTPQQNFESPVVEMAWSDRVFEQLGDIDEKLDFFLPDNQLQLMIDSFAEGLKGDFSEFEDFNRWLDENGAEDWSEQMANYLLKLPARSLREIVSGIYSVVSAALYICVHPLKGVNHLAKEAVQLFSTLSDPTVWPQIGAGSIGALVAKGAVFANPFSLIGFVIGGAMIVGGVSYEAFYAALEAEADEEAHAALFKSFEYAPKAVDSFLTGLFGSLFLGGIKRAMILA